MTAKRKDPVLGVPRAKEQRLNFGLRSAQPLPALTNNRGTLGNLSHANQVARGGAWSRLSCAPDGRQRRRLEGYPRGFPDPARAGPRPSLDLLRQRRDIAEAAGGAGCVAELLRAQQRQRASR